MANKKTASTSTATLDGEEVLTQIETGARHMPQIRDLIAMNIQVGQAYRQGDVYILKVDKTEKGEEIVGSNQLVDGTTKGSRHCASEGVRLFKLLAKSPRGQDGDVLRVASVVVEASKPWVNTHPEHAHAVFPSGTYEVWHQMDFARQQKVRD